MKALLSFITLHKFLLLQPSGILGHHMDWKS